MPDQPSLFSHGGLFSGGANYYPNGRNDTGGSGDNFFSRLFGGFNPPPQPVPAAKHNAAAHAKKLSRAGQTVER
jgi:hypothetical protein